MWKCSKTDAPRWGLSGTSTDAILTDVLELAGRFIAVCWAAFVVVWFIAGWFAKRTVERSGTSGRWLVWIVAVLLVATRGGGAGDGGPREARSAGGGSPRVARSAGPPPPPQGCRSHCGREPRSAGTGAPR